MPYIVDFMDVSTVGLESSPVAEALAGLRANEARYFKNKYDHDFTVEPAAEADGDGRLGDAASSRRSGTSSSRSRPLEATAFEVEGIRMAYVFYESGLSINVMYTLADGGKRAVGFKLSEGMEVPEELARVQVRPAEVEARGNHPRLVLRDQGRVLTGRSSQQAGIAPIYEKNSSPSGSMQKRVFPLKRSINAAGGPQGQPDRLRLHHRRFDHAEHSN